MKKLALIPLLALTIFVFLKLFYLGDSENKAESLSSKQVSPPDITQSEVVDSSEEGNKTIVLKDLPSKTQYEKQTLIVTQVQQGKSNKSGYAFIAYNGNEEQVYPVGAKLAEGVILKSLLVDGVMIDNHGVLEKHKLKSSPLITKTPKIPTSTEAPPSPPPLSEVEKLPPHDDINSMPPMGIPKEESQSYQKYIKLEKEKAEIERIRKQIGDPPIPEGGEIFPPPPN